MNGQLVIVKCFADKPLLKTACYASGNIVFITSEKAFSLIKKGNSDLFPIGFRAENMFIYEGQALTEQLNWKSLKPWCG